MWESVREIALLPSNVERELGTRLLARSAGVDLNNPEETVCIELIGRTPTSSASASPATAESLSDQAVVQLR